MASSVVGTPSYTAPEILQSKDYDFRCDYWSLGVILFLLLSGTLPFEHEDTIELFEMIKEGKYNKKAGSWRYVSAQAKNLISGLLVVDPDYRLKKEQIQDHVWFSGAIKLSDDIIPINIDKH